MTRLPTTVNPSLWRQARLNMHHGLFQVTDRIYQVRGFDASNMTLIEGDRGLIVVDPLISTETARAGLDLYRRHRGQRPVTAVIYTHCHVDHYGGVRGVVDRGRRPRGRVAIIAPDQFMEAVVAESVLAGPGEESAAAVPVRQAPAQGAARPGRHRHSARRCRGAPSRSSRRRARSRSRSRRTRIDGVEIVFQLAPQTEAPAEMHMFYPGLPGAESGRERHPQACTTSIRSAGAEVRDANAWARYLNEALDRFGADTDVVFAQHQWPVWGTSACSTTWASSAISTSTCTIRPCA